MNLEKVIYYLKKSEEELQNQCQINNGNDLIDDTDYKLAMARLYNALDKYNAKITTSLINS